MHILRPLLHLSAIASSNVQIPRRGQDFSESDVIILTIDPFPAEQGSLVRLGFLKILFLSETFPPGPFEASIDVARSVLHTRAMSAGLLNGNALNFGIRQPRSIHARSSALPVCKFGTQLNSGHVHKVVQGSTPFLSGKFYHMNELAHHRQDCAHRIVSVSSFEARLQHSS